MVTADAVDSWTTHYNSADDDYYHRRVIAFNKL